MRRASLNRARPGLHAEPLDVAIGRLLAPYCPGAATMVIDGDDTTNTQKNFLAVIYGTSQSTQS